MRYLKLLSIIKQYKVLTKKNLANYLGKTDAKYLVAKSRSDGYRSYFCIYCGEMSGYYPKYDLYGCTECDIWLEKFCKPEPNGVAIFESPDHSPNGVPYGDDFFMMTKDVVV